MQITFLGATREVTGSCHLIELKDFKILLDCGLIQGSHEQEELNRKPFDFDPSRIDAVVLSHAHIDHSGRLPLLKKQGFEGPVYAQSATIDLGKILLEDAGYLNEHSAEWENRKRERKGLDLIEPLYTYDDAQQVLGEFESLEYRQAREILPGIQITLYDAGHILGSSIVEVQLTQGSEQRTLIYSGDLGHSGEPILKNPSQLHHADLVIMESTYGDRLHRSWQATWQELGEIIRSARNDKANILIPAFTVGRTQELLYIFGQFYDDWELDKWQIFLDSPMAIEATKVYSQHADIYSHNSQRRFKECGNPFDLPNLHPTASTEESIAINSISSGAIIIAGSGMCTGGRIKQHMKHNIWRKHSHLVIVGFQVRGTLGRALVDGADTINLWGETIKVNAEIHTLGGLSAHADQAGLIEWYQNFKHRPPLVLVHGEAEAQDTLCDELKKTTGCDVHPAEHGETIDLLSL